MNLPYKQHSGFTLVELLIGVTVVVILFSTGLSAYSISRDRQEIRGYGEIIETHLREVQKSASIGNQLISCDGIIFAYTVSIVSTTDTITTSVDCREYTATPGPDIVLPLPSNLDIETDTTITFLFNGGMDISGSPNIDFKTKSNAITHQIKVSKPGSITYEGAI